MIRTYIRDLASQVGQKVLLKGWVVNRRDLGKIVFLDLKDFSGQTQVVVVPQKEAAYAGAQKVRDWWVVAFKDKCFDCGDSGNIVSGRVG